MSKHIIDVNEANFATEVEQAATPVFVDIWAPWCAPCRALAPLFEKLADTYGSQIKFVKLNADENKELVARLDVKGLPTLLLFKQGAVVERTAGSQSKTHFTDLLDRYVERPVDAAVAPKAVKTYRAFYGDATLRDAVVERVKKRILADQIVTGLAPVYDEAASVCSLMGAAVQSDDMERYEGTLSIPAHVARLEEVVHGFLSQEITDAEGNKSYVLREPTLNYPLDWLKAIPLGADLQLVTPEFIRWFLLDIADAPQPYGVVVNDAAKTSAREIASLYAQAARGEPPTAEVWKQARKKVSEVEQSQSAAVRKSIDDGGSFDASAMFSLVVVRGAEMLAVPIDELESGAHGALGLAFYILTQAAIPKGYPVQEWAKREALSLAATRREGESPDATPQQLEDMEEVRAYKAYLASVQESDNALGNAAKNAFGEHLHRGLMTSLATVTTSFH